MLVGRPEDIFTLDWNSHYWQVEIAGGDRNKSEFVSHHWVVQGARRPFGLNNGQGIFQRATGFISSTIHWQLPSTSGDEFVIFSKSLEAHIKHMNHPSTLLRGTKSQSNWKVRIRLKQHWVFWSWHPPGHLQVSKRIINAATDFKSTAHITIIRLFISSCDVFGYLVSKRARISTPLNEKCRSNCYRTSTESAKMNSSPFQQCNRSWFLYDFIVSVIHRYLHSEYRPLW